MAEQASYMRHTKVQFLVSLLASGAVVAQRSDTAEVVSSNLT